MHSPCYTNTPGFCKYTRFLMVHHHCQNNCAIPSGAQSRQQ